jgi:hypothetical protein
MPADEAQQQVQSLQLREKRVVEDAASALWSLFLDIIACGRLWSEYVVLTPSDQQQFANMFFDEMCLVAPTTCGPRCVSGADGVAIEKNVELNRGNLLAFMWLFGFGPSGSLFHIEVA